VIALVKAAVPSPAKYIESHLTQNEKLAIAALPYANFTAFIDDVITAVAAQQLERREPAGMIFKRSEFEAVRDAVSAVVVEKCFEVSALVAKVAAAARDANKAIGEIKSFDFLSVLSVEKAHIAELITPNFVSQMGLERLPRLEVYLRAIKQRLEKLPENSVRDRLSVAEYDQAFGLFAFAGGQLPLPVGADAKLVAARWLLEELRVSLFAQSLGAAEAVSVQRIKKALG
jgi:ATP-dependent helicase HrpA